MSRLCCAAVREPALDTLLRQQRPPRWAAAAALSAVGSLEDLLQRRFSDMDPPWLAQAVGLFSTCHTSWVLLGGEAGCLDGQQLSPARLEELSAQAAKVGLRAASGDCIVRQRKQHETRTACSLYCSWPSS